LLQRIRYSSKNREAHPIGIVVGFWRSPSACVSKVGFDQRPDQRAMTGYTWQLK
jgi:hypothetical protein